MLRIDFRRIYLLRYGALNHSLGLAQRWLGITSRRIAELGLVYAPGGSSNHGWLWKLHGLFCGNLTPNSLSPLQNVIANSVPSQALQSTSVILRLTFRFIPLAPPPLHSTLGPLLRLHRPPSCAKPYSSPSLSASPHRSPSSSSSARAGSPSLAPASDSSASWPLSPSPTGHPSVRSRLPLVYRRVSLPRP